MLDADAGGLDAIAVLHRLKRAGVPSEVLVAAPDRRARAAEAGHRRRAPAPSPSRRSADHVRHVVRRETSPLGTASRTRSRLGRTAGRHVRRPARPASPGRRAGAAGAAGRSARARSAAIAATTSGSVVGPAGSLAILRAGPERRRAHLHGDVGDAPARRRRPRRRRRGRAGRRGRRWRRRSATSVVNVSSLRARLGDPRLGDERAVVAAEAEDAQVGPDRRPEVAGQLAVVGAGELLDGA